MDYLKNTLEEIVIQEVEDAFRTHPEICHCLQCKKDVTVFVLNNIKPRYIISTRGMLHESANKSDSSRVISEIRELIPEGIQRVNEHKRPNFDHNEEDANLLELMGKTKRFTMTAEYFRNYPFFIGEVRDSVSGKSLSDVTITLKVDGEVIEGWDGNWPNPYNTSEKSGCKFAFWPKPSLAENQEKITSIQSHFEIELNRDGYRDRIISFEILMESQHYIINFIRKDYTKDLEIVEMEKI